jgi:hypothetical protein
MAITIDHKLNIIIVLLVVLLGFAVFSRYSEKYDDPVEEPLACAKCLQKLDNARACNQINGYFDSEGCAKSAPANKLLMDARSKYGSNLCNTIYQLPCDNEEPATPRGNCIPTTHAFYTPNKKGYITPQCPEGSEVTNLQVDPEKDMESYDCCPL